MTVHSASFVDRTNVRYGALLALEHVGRDGSGRAVWRCRCRCGRPDCLGEVHVHSGQLAKGRRQCHGGGQYHPPSPTAPATVALAPGLMLPEGVRPVWERPAGLRQARDAELLAVWAGVRV